MMAGSIASVRKAKDNELSISEEDIFVCNNIQTTIPNIQTTNLIVKTTNPMVQTTISHIQTTIPRIQTNIPQIQTNIPRIKITIPQTQTSIPQTQTTIPKIQTTSPEITNEEILLILLGFNFFRLSSSTISFNVLFTPIFNGIYSNLMKVLLIINYNE